MNTGPRSAARPFLILRNVTVRVQSRPFFSGLNWRVAARQQWAVLGANGAGKTLLACVLRGEVSVSSGDVEYGFGAETANPGVTDASLEPESRISHVAFESQHRALANQETYYQARWDSSLEESTCKLSEWLSRESVMALNPYEILPSDHDPRRFEQWRREVLKLIPLSPLLDRRLNQLSNGEMRKALIARALLQSPRLLILDDPLGGLDSSARQHLGRILTQLMRAGFRLLFLTSRPEELPVGITHILWLDRGKILAQGQKNKVLQLAFGAPRSALHNHQGLPSPAVVEKSLLPIRPQTKAATPSGSGGPPLLELHEVNVAYGGVTILSRINWTVRRGEHWALLGPNGSGKTTLLSLITGDNLQAYSNDIRVFGKRLGRGFSLWELRRRLALLSPELHLHYPGGVTGWETVCSGLFDTLGLYQRPSSRQKMVVQDCLSRFQLSALAESAFGNLSMGQQRLCLLARALVKEPQLLILDEPCQGLDPDNRQRVLEAIEQIGRETHTQFIFVTHDPREIPACATHRLRLSAGQIIEQARVKAN